MSTRARSTVALVLAALLGTSCSHFPGEREEEPYQYRHAEAACRSCHPTEKVDPASVATAVPEPAACLECHRYRENHHPIDVIPDNRGVYVFPLANGRLSCLTCHEIHGGPSHQAVPKLLRGGPYGERRGICFNCHPQQKAPLNPHRMLDARGKPLQLNGKPVCLVCHRELPDPERDTAEKAKLRADVAFLCWRCHPPMPGSFLGKHFLVDPSIEQRMYINKKQEEMEVRLPLIPWGRITCSTCHNPHQAGVIGRTETAKGADSKHKLRHADLCSVCHVY